MGWEILTKIPWKEIVKFAPIIVASSLKLQKTVHTHLKATTNHIDNKFTDKENALVERIQKLENNEIEQANLNKNIAEQLSNISHAIQILSKRIIFSISLSISALLIAIVLIILKIGQ